MQVEFGDEIFYFEFVSYLNLTVSRSGASLLRTSNSNFHVATCLGLHRPRRLVPTSGVRISQFGLGCLHRKQAQHPPNPSRTSAFVTCCCRCAPRPDAFGWACVLLTALTSAGAPQDRARLPEIQQTSLGSPRLPTFREISPHARLFACTSGLLCRRLWVCVLVVSC